MTIEPQRYWIVFNGEIYNFVELREALVGDGFHFRSSSDTEVLLALWQQQGRGALRSLRGMFAFILYDREADVVWAVRDRFGIKPLYYALLPGNGGVVLASEFRGIHASGLVPRKWDEFAVEAFLAAGVNKPGDVTTFFDGVSELPPGCVLEVGPGTIRMDRYYHLPPPERPTAGAEVSPELRRLFIEVTGLHLRSAREVGTCMSGGLDSTSIASAIHEELGDRVNSFKAFTIGSRGDAESRLARLASERIGLSHYTINAPRVISPADLADMIVTCETPNHVWGPINQYLLFRHIGAEHGIHVVLNGQGGDEVFSGYAWFQPVIERAIREHHGAAAAASFRASHFARPPFPVPLLEWFHRSFFSRRRWIEGIEGGALACMGRSVEEVLEWDAVQYYLNDELDWAEFREREFYRKELQLLLRQEDRLAMRFSIESRVPFLDHEFVERVGTLSPTFLMQDGYLKYPLRVLFPELPEEIRFNVVKRGFWEEHSRLPYFASMAREAVRHSEGVSKFVRDERRLDGLSSGALWRLFQMALLFEAGSRDAGRAWVDGLLKRMPMGAIALRPWVQGVRRRVATVLRQV